MIQGAQESAPLGRFANFTPTMSAAEFDFSGRYPVTFPGLNTEDIYAEAQSIGQKWAYGAGKMINNAAVTFINGTAGLVYGVGAAAINGDFTSFYDNDFTRSLNEYQEHVNNTVMPHYVSQKERDMSVLGQLTRANFWSDTILSNTGFAVGAFASGAAWAKLGSVVSSVSKSVASKAGVQILDAAKKAQNLERANLLARTGDNLGKVSGNLKQVADRYVNWSNFKNFGANFSRAGIATFGEASMEAIGAKNQYKETLISEFQDKHGRKPQGYELTKIEREAESVGNFTMGANMALLSATNYIQFPKIAGMMWKADRRIISDAERAVGRVVMESADGTAVRTGTAAAFKKGVKYTAKPTLFGKVRDVTKAYGGLLFSAPEAFEEGSQFVIPIAATEYFGKGQDSEDPSWLNAFKEGAKELVTSKDGMISLLAGGITGSIMTNFNPMFGGKMFNSVRQYKQKKANTQKFVDELNASMGGSGYLADMVESLKRGEVLNEEAFAALQQRNRLQYEDTKTDQTLNYLIPRIKNGRYDLVKDDIRGLKEVASTDEGFGDLIANGFVAEGTTRQEYIDNLNKLEQVADTVNSQYQALELRYGNQTIKDEEGNSVQKYSPENLMQLAYVGAKIDDYNRRIPGLLQKFNEVGIDILSLMERVHTSALTAQEESQLRTNATISNKELEEYKKNNRLEYNQLKVNLNEAGQELSPEEETAAADDMLRQLLLETKLANLRNKATQAQITREDLEQIGDQINALPNLSMEERGTLTEEAADLLEISARRDFKIKEYEQIVRNPDLFQSQVQGMSVVEPGMPDPSKVDFTKVEPELEEGDYDAVRQSIEDQLNNQALTPAQEQLRADYPALYEALWETVSEANAASMRKRAEEAGWYRDSQGNPVPPTQKSRFFDENQGRYTMNVNGIQREGELNYDPDQDALFFEYTAEDGTTKQTQVFNEDFNSGDLLRSDGIPVMDNGYLTQEDAQAPNRAQSRARQLLNEVNERHKQIAEEISILEEELSSINETLSQTEKEATELTTDFVTSISNLSGQKRIAEQWIEELKNEQTQLAQVHQELQQIILAPPTSLRSSIELLRRQNRDIEGVQAYNARLLDSMGKLLDSASDLLRRLGRKAITFISRMNGVPPTPSFETLKNLFTTWEQTGRDSDLDTAIRFMREQYEGITNFTVRPFTAGELKWISEKITEVQERVQDVNPIVQAKNTVAERLEEISNEISEREEIVLKTPPTRTPTPEEVTPTEEELDEELDFLGEQEDTFLEDRVKELEQEGKSEEEAFQEAKEEWNKSQAGRRAKTVKDKATTEVTTEKFDEDSDKTPIERFFKATVQLPPDERNKTFDKRINKFISKLLTFDRNRRPNLRLMTVTRKTEESLGLTGFVDKFFKITDKNNPNFGQTYPDTNPNDAPIGLVLVEKTDTGFKFLDENGNIIEGQDNLLDKILVTKMKTNSGTWSDGQTAYSNPRNKSSDEINTIKQDFTELREEVHASTTQSYFPFTLSQGRDPKDSTTKSEPITGNLITEEDMKAKRPSLEVVRSKSKTKVLRDPSGGEVQVPSGSIILRTRDFLQRVFTRPLTDREKGTVMKSLKRLAQLRDQELQGSEEALRLRDFLSGSTFIRFGTNLETFTLNKQTINLTENAIDKASAVQGVRNILTGQKANVYEPAINKNTSFQEVTGFSENGEAQFREWPTYQEFLLSQEGGRTPLVYAPHRVDRYLIMNYDKATNTTKPVTPTAKKRTPEREAVKVAKDLPPTEEKSSIISTLTDLIGNVRKYFTNNDSSLTPEQVEVEEQKATAAANVIHRMANVMARKFPQRYPNGVQDVYASLQFTDVFNGLQEGTLKQIVGETGAVSADIAEGVSRRVDALTLAQQLEQDGTPPGIIKKLTGWEKNLSDNMWRYEVPDFQLKENVLIVPNEDGEATVKLSDIYDVSEMTKYYPNVGNVEVRVSSKLRAGTAFWDGEVINVPMESWVRNKPVFRSLLLHELQHYIQDTEGHAQGGSLLSVAMDRLVRKNGFSTFQEYHDSLLNLLERAEALPDSPEKTEILRQIDEADVEKSYSSQELQRDYLRIAGEVEARAVQARLGLTEQERRNTLIEHSMDVAPEDRYVLLSTLGLEVSESNEVAQITDTEGNVPDNLKGTIDFVEGGKAIIYAMNGRADVSTFLHEMAHFYEANGLTEQEQDTVLQEAKKYYGREDVTPEEVSEYFARGFESFLAQERGTLSQTQRIRSVGGKLSEIFKQLRQFLVDIYENIVGSEIDIPLSPQIDQLYQDMLGIKYSKLKSKAKKLNAKTIPDEVIGESIIPTIRVGKMEPNKSYLVVRGYVNSNSVTPLPFKTKVNGKEKTIMVEQGQTLLKDNLGNYIVEEIPNVTSVIPKEEAQQVVKTTKKARTRRTPTEEAIPSSDEVMEGPALIENPQEVAIAQAPPVQPRPEPSQVEQQPVEPVVPKRGRKEVEVTPQPKTKYKTEATAEDVNGGIFTNSNGQTVYILPFFSLGYVQTTASTYNAWQKASTNKRNTIINSSRQPDKVLKKGNSVTLTTDINGVEQEQTYTVTKVLPGDVEVTSNTGETISIGTLYAKDPLNLQVRNAFDEKYIGLPFKNINTFLNPPATEVDPVALPEVDLRCK